MALDFHRLDNNEFLFELDDNKCKYLNDIFHTFEHWTGIFIDPFKHSQLTVENQVILIRMIDQYFDKTNLNSDKEKTICISGFRGLLEYFSKKNIDFKLLGD